MPLNLPPLITMLYVASMVLYAILYARPRSVASPKAGYSMWRSLLGASLIAFVPAAFSLLAGPSLQVTSILALNIATLAVCVAALSLFQLRPLHNANPGSRALGQWKTILALALVVALISALMPLAGSP